MEEIRITIKGRILHRENSNPVVRKHHVTHLGNMISLLGRHGFDWEVGIMKNSHSITIIRFNNREDAIRHYKLVCKNY